MAEVAAINQNVKRTIEVVCTWQDAKADRGELPSNTARLRNTALRALVTPLAADEPNDIEWVYAHLEDLGRRWATLNPQYKSDTAVTYMSRAKASLDDYFRWEKDPSAFKFRERPVRAEKPKTERAAKVESKTDATHDVTSAGVPDAEWEPTVPGTISNSFRFGNGREFRFKMPDDITVPELRRIAAHLLTYAQDWEPVSPVSPVESSSIVKSQQ